MIASHDHSWIILTPSRTGSRRIRSLVKSGVARRFPPWHGGTAAQFSAFERRIMIARNPMDRWCSLYWYLKENIKRTSTTMPRAVRDHFESWPEFMDVVFKTRSRNMVIAPLSRHAFQFRPHDIVFVEEIDRLWEMLDLPSEAVERYRRTSLHRSKFRLTVKETLEAHGPLSDAVRAWVAQETVTLDQFGAGRPATLLERAQAS